MHNPSLNLKHLVIKFFLIAGVATVAVVLTGCGNQQVEKFTCYGADVSETVVGERTEQLKNNAVIPIELKKANVGISEIFQEPAYLVAVNGLDFDRSLIKVSADLLTGKQDAGQTPDAVEANFAFDRRSKVLKYHFSAKSVDQDTKLPRRDTMEFEGLCKAAND
jgi:hypothetical protein